MYFTDKALHFFFSSFPFSLKNDSIIFYRFKEMQIHLSVKSWTSIERNTRKKYRKRNVLKPRWGIYFHCFIFHANALTKSNEIITGFFNTTAFLFFCLFCLAFFYLVSFAWVINLILRLILNASSQNKWGLRPLTLMFKFLMSSAFQSPKGYNMYLWLLVPLNFDM